MPWACSQRQFSLKKELGRKDQCYQFCCRVSSGCLLRSTFVLAAPCVVEDEFDAILGPHKCSKYIAGWTGQHEFLMRSWVSQGSLQVSDHVSGRLLQHCLHFSSQDSLGWLRQIQRAVEKGTCAVEICLQPSKCPTRSQS